MAATVAGSSPVELANMVKSAYLELVEPGQGTFGGISAPPGLWPASDVRCCEGPRLGAPCGAGGARLPLARRAPAPAYPDYAQDQAGMLEAAPLKPDVSDELRNLVKSALLEILEGDSAERRLPARPARRDSTFPMYAPAHLADGPEAIGLEGEVVTFLPSTRLAQGGGLGGLARHDGDDVRGVLDCDCGDSDSRAPSLSTPSIADSSSVADRPAELEARTTLMLRNLPNDYTRSMLCELLDAMSFGSRYDFVYFPMDFTRKAGLGYAFVNLVTEGDALQVSRALEGFRQWAVPSSKVCNVCWNVPCQGLEANIQRYRSSPIMHRSVPDEFKPALFRDGVRVPFPKPTRKLRKPDSRRGGC